ncbi:Polyadenylate-binding protein, cytoplasmic and nuclear [Cercospora zeina]
MFALRRIAARAIQCQPARQLSSIRCTPLTVRINASKPALYRSFHQSQRWFNDEEQKKDDVSAAEQTEVKEESIATSEVADAATDTPAPAEDGVQQASQEVSNATQAATDALSSAVETVSSTVASAGGANRNFPGDSHADPSQKGKILYVGNLFFQVTAPELEAEFSRIGQVVNSRVVEDPTGKSRGFGYIEFATKDEAERAISELDQKTFQGRRMAVQHHVRREPRPTAGQPRENSSNRSAAANNPPSKTLFVGNMPYQMSDRDLNDLFRDVKNVLDVRVAIDRRSGQPRGFAHADFVDVASAENAKAYLGNKVVYGRELRVNFSISGQRTGQDDKTE